MLGERGLDAVVGCGSLVRDGKCFRFLSVCLDEFEELGFLDSQERLGSEPVYLFAEIALEDFFTSSSVSLLCTCSITFAS